MDNDVVIANSGLTVIAAAALLGTGFVVALGPSLSSILVASRSSTLGLVHGAYTAAGVVAGDVALLCAAVLGLTAGTVLFEHVDLAVRYLGGGFLLWLGARTLLMRQPAGTEQPTVAGVSAASSFAAGLLLTLADLKAIAFYLALLPAFIDLELATPPDLMVLVAIIAVSVGGAKLAWAYMGARSASAVPPRLRSALQRLGAIVLIAVGALLLLR